MAWNITCLEISKFGIRYELERLLSLPKQLLLFQKMLCGVVSLGQFIFICGCMLISLYIRDNSFMDMRCIKFSVSLDR